MKKRIHYTDKYLINPSHQVSVNLIGIGGTGSQVLTALARIDHALYKLGHPGLYVRAYDPDVVTAGNLGRQLFSESDLGVNKATVFVTRVNNFFGNSWNALPEAFEFKNDSRANITISCVDNLKSRLMLHKHFSQLPLVRTDDNDDEIYWLDFGNARNTGQVVLGSVVNIDQPKIKDVATIPKIRTVGEMFDLSKLNDDDSGPSCSLAEALSKQDLFINSTLAQIGGALLWKLLSTGSIDYQGAYLNLENMNVNAIKL